MTSDMHILALDGDDIVKIIFGVVFAVIWALSGLMSWLNKRHQEAQRRRAAEEVARASRYSGQPPPPTVPQRAMRRGPMGEVAPLPSSQMPPPPPPPSRRINEGLARRHPEVLRAPLPLSLPRPAPRRPVPPPPLPQAQQRRGKKVGRRPPPPPRAVEPMLPTLELAEVRGRGSGRSGTAPIEATAIGEARPPVRSGGGGASANAATIRQWLTPQTLRSQYILTEILQPPLALRPERGEP